MDRQDREAVWIIASTPESGDQISSIFTEANFTNSVRLFRNASEFLHGLDRLRELPAILVLDLDMCMEESEVLLSRLRSRPDWEKVAILAVLSRENESRLDRAYDSGVRTYLFKPFAFGQFLERARLLNVQFVIGPRET